MNSLHVTVPTKSPLGAIEAPSTPIILMLAWCSIRPTWTWSEVTGRLLLEAPSDLQQQICAQLCDYFFNFLYRQILYLYCLRLLTYNMKWPSLSTKYRYLSEWSKHIVLSHCIVSTTGLCLLLLGMTAPGMCRDKLHSPTSPDWVIHRCHAFLSTWTDVGKIQVVWDMNNCCFSSGMTAFGAGRDLSSLFLTPSAPRPEAFKLSWRGMVFSMSMARGYFNCCVVTWQSQFPFQKDIILP